MNRLDPDRLYVEYRGVTPVFPIIPRKYTLTHSDVTAELFLTIGIDYAFDKITSMRDEVLGRWIENTVPYSIYYFYGSVYIDGEFGAVRAAIRNSIFIRELPQALEAIRYGDNRLFLDSPYLDKTPIYIYFQSTLADYNRTEYWGTFNDYK